MNKKLMLTIASLLWVACFPGPVLAQDNDTVSAETPVVVTESKPTNFHFVYIDHEPTTPIDVLCKRLKTYRNNALETGDALIIYMANEEQPLVSFTNLSETDTLHRDSEDNYYNIIDELQETSYHEVSASNDLKYIKRLIAVDGLFPLFDDSDEEQMLYKSVAIDFYIGRRFWALHYNEDVIAQLYVSLQLKKFMDKYPFTKLSFNVFKPKGEELNTINSQLFGSHDIEGISQKIRILEYKREK